MQCNYIFYLGLDWQISGRSHFQARLPGTCSLNCTLCRASHGVLTLNPGQLARFNHSNSLLVFTHFHETCTRGRWTTASSETKTRARVSQPMSQRAKLKLDDRTRGATPSHNYGPLQVSEDSVNAISGGKIMPVWLQKQNEELVMQGKIGWINYRD